MIIAILYVLALLSPIILLAIMNFFDARQARTLVEASPFQAEEPAPRVIVDSNRSVALEAQFLVAPLLAVQEAEARLWTLAPDRSEDDALIAARSAGPRLYFEVLLVELEREEQYTLPRPQRGAT